MACRGRYGGGRYGGGFMGGGMYGGGPFGMPDDKESMPPGLRHIESLLFTFGRITQMLEGVCAAKGIDWAAKLQQWKKAGQWHVEVY